MLVFSRVAFPSLTSVGLIDRNWSDGIQLPSLLQRVLFLTHMAHVQTTTIVILDAIFFFRMVCPPLLLSPQSLTNEPNPQPLTNMHLSVVMIAGKVCHNSYPPNLPPLTLPA